MSAATLGELLDLIADKTINGRIAKEVFEVMVETGDEPASDRRARGPAPGDRHRRDRRGGRQGDGGERGQGGRIPAGKDKLFGFFVGQVMKAMEGKGNPALVNEALKQKLS